MNCIDSTQLNELLVD